MKRRTLALLGFLGLITGMLLSLSLGQPVTGKKFLVYDYDKLMSFYKSEIVSKVYPRITNIPSHAFLYGDKICALYTSSFMFSDYLIFTKNVPPPDFFLCTDSNLSNLQVYSAEILPENMKPLKGDYNKLLGSYIGSRKAIHLGIVNTFTLKNNLYVFHRIDHGFYMNDHISSKVFVIVYDQDFKRVREVPLEIFSSTNTK
ncbi:MAG: hypothetical protein GXO48_09760, partial [Chlorobi bacterium]|nr:hypothetical protein [Chlorobiota bacterium]